MDNLNGKIGLEIHSYLLTNEKLFCNCKASREKGLKPNSFICPICTGQPGCKPMNSNSSAVEKSVQIGLILGCKINNILKWQRKHYDWPDLPKGYQTTISGSVEPIGIKGKFHGIGIWGMHLEEDPASWDPDTGAIDYNRSGLPLVEIVTAPDFKNSDEVVDWLKKLVRHFSYLKTIDSNAGIKVDVNVNISGKTERVEIKNINSLENIKKAIDYELERQNKEGSVRETRRFDAVKGKTIRMRGKEEQDDYRFIRDPDLKEIVLSEKFIEKIKKNLPESPEEKLEKLVSKFKIDKKNAEVLAKEIDLVEFFEKVADKVDSRFALPWITVELLGQLNYHKKELSDLNIDIKHFIILLESVKERKITELQGKKYLMEFFVKGSFDVSKNLKGKIDDEKELTKIISKILFENKSIVEKYKNGEKNLLNFLMGEIMKKTERRADFKIARNVLEELLK